MNVQHPEPNSKFKSKPSRCLTDDNSTVVTFYNFNNTATWMLRLISTAPSMKNTNQFDSSFFSLPSIRNWLMGSSMYQSFVLALLILVSGTAVADQQRQVDPLNQIVDRAIETTKRRMLRTQHNTPWQISHGLLALRQDFVLQHEGGTINAIEWLSNGAHHKDKPWFEASAYGGRAHPYSGTMKEFEGHVNQTLAIIAMSNLPLDHEFKLPDGKVITMQGLVNHAKMMVNDREEITWTLWFLTHYLDPDSQWTNAYGEEWSIERLVKMQSRADLNRSPCGGTHGLFALAYARNDYLQKHGRLSGSWVIADQKLQQHLAAARSMQNRDGSFATKFFKARGHSYEFEERILSSGHMLEWMMMALPKRRLNEYWVRNGVNSLANDLIRNSAKPADPGPLYHALHALILYRQRMNPDSQMAPPQSELAQADTEPVGPITSNESTGDSVPNKIIVESSRPLVQNTPQKNNSAEMVKPVPNPYANSEESVVDMKSAKPAIIAQTPSVTKPKETAPAVPMPEAEAVAESKPKTMKAPLRAPTAIASTQIPSNISEPSEMTETTNVAEAKPESSATTLTSDQKRIAKLGVGAIVGKGAIAIEQLPKGLMPILKPSLLKIEKMAERPLDSVIK